MTQSEFKKYQNNNGVLVKKESPGKKNSLI